MTYHLRYAIAHDRANHASLWFLPRSRLEVGLFKQR
jgi:hypothetical protein